MVNITGFRYYSRNKIFNEIKIIFSDRHPIINNDNLSLANLFDELAKEIFYTEFNRGAKEESGYLNLKKTFDLSFDLHIYYQSSKRSYYLVSDDIFFYSGNLKKFDYLFDDINKIVTDMVREIENQMINQKFFY